MASGANRVARRNPKPAELPAEIISHYREVNETAAVKCGVYAVERAFQLVKRFGEEIQQEVLVVYRSMLRGTDYWRASKKGWERMATQPKDLLLGQ